MTATALLNIAVLLRLEGRLEQAGTLLEESLRICRELGDIIREASVLHAMGSVALTAGHRDTAGRRYRDALRIRVGVGARNRIAQSLEGVAATMSDERYAARLFGCADSVRDAVGAPRKPEEEPVYERALAELRNALGEDSLRQAMEAGRALSLEAACALVLA